MGEMKLKGKTPSTWRGSKKLSFPVVFLLCSLFFVAGFYGSILLSQVHANPVSLSLSLKMPLDEWKEWFERSSPETGSRSYKLEEDGDESSISLPHGKTGDPSVNFAPFQVLSWRPRALYFPRFAEASQCETIIKIAKTTMKPSSLALRKGETAENTKGIRTSSGTFISAKEDRTGTLELIEKKIAKVTMIPRSHGEAFNVLRYEKRQKYDSHYDVFNPAEYGPQKSQRMASFLIYLTDVEEGGETMFPFEDGKNIDTGYDYQKCIGLKVKPRQGDALLFYSLFPNGTIDVTSLHGSCPVIKGEKWVATKWIRDQIDK